MSADSSKMKKAKGKYVPSRFKQAAEAYTSQLDEGATTCNITSTTYRGKMSTPTKGCAAPNFSVSRIEPSLLKEKNKVPSATSLNKTVMPSTGKMSSAPQKESSVPQKESSVLQKVKSAPQKKKKATNEAEILKQMEAEIDVIYSEYQLALRLEHLAKMSIREQSKQAAVQIGALVNYTKELLSKDSSVRRELYKISSVVEFHSHLKKMQEDILSPFLKILPDFEKKYEDISTAVENSGHKLEVRDIVIPEEGLEGEFTKLVKKIVSQLDQISRVLGVVENIVDSSAATGSFAETFEEVDNILNRVLEQLQMSQDLLISDTFLKSIPGKN